jgi:hypothetical protein
MTPRSIRRAAERKARKEARKLAKQITAPAHHDRNTAPTPSPDTRLAANRANALHSTGPRTPAGKSVSARNALKTALTGRTVLLPSDDRARYEQHLTSFFDQYNPAGDHECALVQALADTWWRLLRIPALEAALYAKGRTELCDNTAADFLEIEPYLKYEKQFRNLALQEQRLSRYADRLTAELAEIQSQRTAETQSEAEPQPLSAGTDELGFVFSPAPAARPDLLAELDISSLTCPIRTHSPAAQS